MAYGNKTYAVIQRDQVCYWSSWKGAMNQVSERGCSAFPVRSTINDTTG
jgi:hypothetical protein